MTENFLEHFGVKGMKWGIRKDRRSGKAKTSKEVAKTLTNKELTKRINRLNMEKQYSDLAKAEPSSVAKGSKIVAGVVANIGGTAAKQAAQTIANELAADAGKLLFEVVKKKAKSFRT